ncbi:SPOR domain-containing protein [Sunxiuqinia sp. A32]|uniref:SPOR domain-containing protein n=1 Tax=Sunxiuqinia sp. A32 TaxID=3461496 RepID=UPI004045C2D2
MKYFVLGIILLFTLSSTAQEQSYESLTPQSQSPKISQAIQVQQDARIDSLLKTHIDMNKRLNGTDGFRLEIFFESGIGAREKALVTKTDFLRKYQDVTAYITFLSPNFKVRVGDFRTKNEALKLKARIKRDYPNAFIVKDIIQFPELNTERTSNE